MSNFPAISWRHQVTLVLDQHEELDFYTASSLKRQSDEQLDKTDF